MDKNEEKAYEDGFVAGMQHDAESRVSKFIDASMREWVGLTDEEMFRCSYDADGFMIDREVAMRVVEAKLREKNGG